MENDCLTVKLALGASNKAAKSFYVFIILFVPVYLSCLYSYDSRLFLNVYISSVQVTECGKRRHWLSGTVYKTLTTPGVEIVQ